MPEIPNTWNILKSARRNDYAVIIGIILIFIFIIGAGLHLVFEKMADQTESMEQLRLDGIRDDFREMLAESENMTLRVATSTEQILAYQYSDDALIDFFEQQQHMQKQIPHIECTRIYMIDQDLNSLPYFDESNIFRIIRLALYRMASKNPNTVLTLEPQIDPETGEMQITMAKLLSDDQTVIALNFKLVDMQEIITRMVSDQKATALITTGNGMIIANSNMDLVGARILKKLPEYESVLERILDPRSHDNFQVTINGTSRTIFSSEIRDGWQMILSVESFDLYRNDYMQILYLSTIALTLLIVLIFLYLFGLKNRLHAEQSLHVQEEFLSRLSRELREPLLRILKISDIGTLKGESGISENATQVRESAIQLSNMLDNLFSYSNIVLRKQNVREDNSARILQLSRISRMARTGIVAVLILAMIGSLTVCLRTTMDLGDTKMNSEIDSYNNYFSTWITRRRTIMNMFVDTMIERPELVRSYYDTVDFLNDISKHYSEIYVCYLANSEKDWKFASNTDYKIPPEYQIERQKWYIDAESANGEIAISAPYYSERTGNYCITFSQAIYDRNGEFIGILGLDFFINDLMQFFSESYRENGYAFLIDGNGIILNHPNTLYQISKDVKRNILDTEYESAYSSEEIVTLEDYSGKYVACLAKKNPISDFGVVIVNRWWNNIYGNNIIISLIFIAVFSGFIFVVIVLINRLIRWQNNVQNQLTEAANAAVAAGQAKSQFLAQMSHEIRTPINAVLGMNEMILRESEDKEILGYSENIQRAGRILLNLINNILDFSKIEDGKMEIIPTQYETTILISDLVNMISERARKKNLELKIEIDPSLPKTLYGDDVRIRQVIINILTNAVKYTQEGSVTLSMGGSVVATDKIALCVVVKDTGIGIRKEDMDKLFQSFQRLDEEKNRNIEGTGLGISIVQKLLSMMGSHLEVESVYGEGSSFSFIIEQKIIDTSPIGNYRDRDSVERKKSDKYLRAPDAKILVVDDNDMNLKVIKGLLKRSGIKPDLLSSGKECLERVKNYQYDIIFLDHMMPEMDGIETLQNLKASGNLPDSTTVIVLTANAISGAREMYIDAGFKDYLTKPIEIDALEKTIAKYLSENMVSFEDPNQSEKKIENNSESKSESKSKSKVEEIFDDREIKKFAEICPEIDLSIGLSNCMEERDFLFEMMEEFISNDKTSELEKLFESKDLKNYQIQTHALKSTSQVIGAVELSEIAKSLEMLAKDQKFDESKHHELLKKYRELLHHLKLIFGIEEVVEDQVDENFESKIEKNCPEIDLKIGLSNCMNDTEFLREMMEEFISNDKTSELEKFFESKDLKNYQIQTHALKSTSQVIGAVELSEIAKSLEMLAKDQKFDEYKHHELLKKYRELLHHLKLIFGIEEIIEDQVEENFESKIEKNCPEIDLKIGLSNCMNDPEFLREMMEEFISNDKTSELEKLFESKDLKNYQIQTHALKSTSQVIGAVELSEISKSLEMLAKDQKFDESKHHELLKKYHDLLHHLKLIFGIEEIIEDQVEENFESKIEKNCPEIDLKIGLSNCMNDLEFLREMMEEFMQNDKTSELEKFFESKDLKNYQIQTHALKSTSQVIGAVELSEISKSLEMLAKDQKFDESKHHELLKKYRELLHHLKLIFGIEEIVEDQVEENFESKIEKNCPEIDLKIGLSNCMNDLEFLREMMEEFMQNDKTSELEKFFESKDLKNYQIQTHALKSTSQVIGAVELSEIAKSLEMLAKDQKFDESKHHELLKKYRDLLHHLKLIFGIEEIVEDQVEENFESKIAKNCPEIDLKIGLSNCMNDPEFLREMMEEFISNDKTSELEKFFESKDLKNYQIQTHALKSTSQVIGAVELSEISKSLELNAKNQILDEAKHSEMIEVYRKLLANLKKFLEADARA